MVYTSCVDGSLSIAMLNCRVSNGLKDDPMSRKSVCFPCHGCHGLRIPHLICRSVVRLMMFPGNQWPPFFVRAFSWDGPPGPPGSAWTCASPWLQSAASDGNPQKRCPKVGLEDGEKMGKTPSQKPSWNNIIGIITNNNYIIIIITIIIVVIIVIIIIIIIIYTYTHIIGIWQTMDKNKSQPLSPSLSFQNQSKATLNDLEQLYILHGKWWGPHVAKSLEWCELDWGSYLQKARLFRLVNNKIYSDVLIRQFEAWKRWKTIWFGVLYFGRFQPSNFLNW